MPKITIADGKKSVQLTREEWESAGRQAGWITKADSLDDKFASLGWTLTKRAQQAAEIEGDEDYWLCNSCTYQAPKEDFIRRGGCPSCGADLSKIQHEV